MQPLFLLFALLGLVFAYPQAYPVLNYTLALPEIINGTLPPPEIIDSTEELYNGGQAGFPINPEKRWPRSIAFEVIIPWCFKDAASEQAIGPAIDRGWETWTRTLGLASPQNGHNLQLKRWMPFNTNQYPYCHDANGLWNNRVPADAVMVSYIHNSGVFSARSTQGYNPENRPGRHQIIMSQSQNMDWTAAHELGHIFGLLHEHQRPDRDFFIHFDCRNVQGYEQALAQAQTDGYTHQQLCEQPGVALRYGWAGSEFIKFKPLSADIIMPYDIDSIMHYDCRFAADHARWGHDPTNPTLYPLFTFNPERTVPFLLPLKGGRPYPHFDISAGDAATIRAMYLFYPTHLKR